MNDAAAPVLLKAPMRPGYLLRGLVVGVALAAYGAYCLYDGFIAYPRDREIRQAYDQFLDEGRVSEWSAHAAEKGWPDDTGDEPPGEMHSEFNIQFNVWTGLIITPLGVLMIGLAGYRRFQWIACDGERVTTSWGEDFPVSGVKSVDRTLWDRKGIAVVHYDNGEKLGALKLDDWKYDTDMTRAIVEVLDPTPPDDAAAAGTGPEAGADPGAKADPGAEPDSRPVAGQASRPASDDPPSQT